MSERQLSVLLDAPTIAARVTELGAQLREELGDTPILCIGVLKGSIVFLADLIRAIPGDARISFLGVQSYEGTDSTGAVRLTHDLTEDIAGQHVVVVEDIVDTGLTLKYLLDTLSVRNPASLRIVALLDKPSRRRVDVKPDLVGFTIEDRFVVGYGLDLDQRYRNLPFVGEFK